MFPSQNLVGGGEMLKKDMMENDDLLKVDKIIMVTQCVIKIFTFIHY